MESKMDNTPEPKVGPNSQADAEIQRIIISFNSLVAQLSEQTTGNELVDSEIRSVNNQLREQIRPCLVIMRNKYIDMDGVAADIVPKVAGVPELSPPPTKEELAEPQEGTPQEIEEDIPEGSSLDTPEDTGVANV